MASTEICTEHSGLGLLSQHTEKSAHDVNILLYRQYLPGLRRLPELSKPQVCLPPVLGRRMLAMENVQGLHDLLYITRHLHGLLCACLLAIQQHHPRASMGLPLYTCLLNAHRTSTGARLMISSARLDCCGTT